MSKASSNKKSKSCEEKQTMKFLACIYFCMSVILFAVLFLGQMCQFVWPKRTNCCTFLRKIEQGNVKGNHTPKKKKKKNQERNTKDYQGKNTNIQILLETLYEVFK